jgi:hypothetical protein
MRNSEAVAGLRLVCGIYNVLGAPEESTIALEVDV